MAKIYYTSGTGSQQTLTPANKSKIPIYANETALDADLANIPDNTLVATKGGHDDVIDQMKEYIRKQNELNDWENISISTDPNNPTVMSYDGFLLCFTSQSSSATLKIIVNGTEISDNRPEGGTGFGFIPFLKNDEIRIVHSGNLYSRVRYYKKRDYSNRQSQ